MRRGDLVARVLDDGRERAVAELLAGRQAHGHGELDAIARRHVVEALLELLARVEGARRVLAHAQDAERPAELAALLDAVAATRPQLAEDLAAEAIGLAGADHVAARVE